MKKINVENYKKQRYKRNIFFAAIMIVVCVVMIFNAFNTNKKLNEDNFNCLEGKVVNFEVFEDEYLFGVKNPKDNNKITTINLKLEANANIQKLSDNIVTGDTVEIFYDLEAKVIYKATVNDKLIYDLFAEGIASNNKLIIFYLIVGVLMIAYLTFSIISFVKEPAIKEMDYIEYIITSNRAVTNAMLKEDSKTMQLIYLEKKINKYVFASMIIILIGSILLKSIFTNKLTLLIISLVLVTVAVVLMIVFKPRFYSKHLKTFIDDYLDYLSSGESKTDRTLFLNSDSLKVIKDEQEYNFEYQELNLYSVAAYSKTNAPVNIFICSQLPEKEEYKDFEDFIIPLSKDIYQDVLDNNIKVAGLEELLDNLYNETQTNIKEVKEGFLVKYYN